MAGIAPARGPIAWLDRGGPGVVASLVGLALAIRAVAALRTAVIFNDGPLFLEIVAMFEAGEWLQAFSHHYHPLYPLLASALVPIAGEEVRAAVWVSAAAGSLAVVALHDFVRRAFDARSAWIAALLLAVHPYATRFSADVQSEGLYLALFLAGVAALWRGLGAAAAPSLWSALLAGAFAGLAYLTRPEGVGLVLVGFGCGLALVAQGRWPIARAASWMAVLGLTAALLVAPFVIHIHSVTGEWRLTQKKSLTDLARPDPSRAQEPGDRAPPPPRRRPPPREATALPSALLAALPAAGQSAAVQEPPPLFEALTELLLRSVGAFQPWATVLLAFGLFAARGRAGPRAIFVVAIVLLYGLVLYGLALNVGYLTRRHVLVPLLPLLGYAALGVPVLGAALLRIARRAGLALDDPRRARGTLLTLAIVAAFALPKTLAPHRERQLALRLAAEWLASRDDLRGPVAAEKARSAWYAGEAFIHLGTRTPKVSAIDLRGAGARFLLLDADRLDAYPLLAVSARRLRPMHREDAYGQTALIYDLQKPSPANPHTKLELNLDPKTGLPRAD